MASPSAIPERSIASGAARRVLRPISAVLWIVILSFTAANYVLDRTTTNLLILGVFILLCIAINAEARVRAFSEKRAWRHEALRLDNQFYIDEEMELPNRTYLLSEIRREIARASMTGMPFTLVHLSLYNFDAVRKRRGDDFARLSLQAMTNLVRRVTRQTDFLAHLGGSSFVIMLVNAGAEEANGFLRSAIPGWISASDANQMLDIPIVARTTVYDMNGVYSVDILNELESSTPLMREQRQMPNPA